MRVIVDEINTKSNRNKFKALNKLIINNINIIMVFETKIDDTFLVSKHCGNGYFSPYCPDRTSKGGGLLSYIKENIPSKTV